MKDKNAWNSYDKEELAKLEKLCKSYREFLDTGKTERECVKEIVKQVKKAGYEDIQDVIKEGKKLTKGSKVYAVWMNKTVALFNIGKTAPMEKFRSRRSSIPPQAGQCLPVFRSARMRSPSSRSGESSICRNSSSRSWGAALSSRAVQPIHNVCTEP